MAGSLLASLLLSLPVIQAEFCDEADNLVGGWLIANGWVMYKDYFSHHAPIPHLYSAFIHVVFGKSWAFQRWSIAVFGLINLAFLMGRSRTRSDGRWFYSLALLALLWPMYAVNYWGYMVLADNLAAHAALPLIVIVLDVLSSRRSPSRWEGIWFGMNLFIAGMSNPLLVFPGMVAGLGFLAACWFPEGWRGNRRPWPGLVGAMAGGLVPGLALIAYLVHQDSLELAWDRVIRFNSEVYAQYTGGFGFPSVIKDCWRQAASCFSLTHFGIWDFSLRHDSEMPWGNDQWVFFGLVGRLSILAMVGWALVRKSWLGGLVLYVFAACCLSRAGFHMQHFRLLELWCLCWLGASLVLSWRRQTAPVRVLTSLAMVGWLLIQGVVVANAFATVSAVGMTCKLRPTMPSTHDFSRVCRGLLGQEGKVLVYPLAMHFQYSINYPPAGYFYYVLPWTCHRPEDLQRAVDDLRRAAQENTLVYFDDSGDIWNYPTRVWAKELGVVLREDYLEVAPHFFLSKNASQVRQAALGGH